MAERKHIYTSQETMTASDIVAAITTGAIDRAVGARALKSLIDHLEAEKRKLNTRCGDLWDWAKKLEAEKAELVISLGQIEREASKAVILVAAIPGNQGDHLADRAIWIRNEARRTLAKHEPK